MADPKAFFLETPAGRRFCIFHPAAAQRRGALLHAPALGEEMNRCRPAVAAAARHFAAHGFDVLLIDLFGSGDSAGEFGEATWAHWLDDLACGVRWLRGPHDRPPHPAVGDVQEDVRLWLWGLRAGCLLACALQSRLEQPVPMLWWQAIPTGELQVQQWLRQGLAGAMVSGAAEQPAPVAAQLRNAFEAGSTLEIGGYAFAPGLTHALRGARLEPPIEPDDRRAEPNKCVVALEVAAAAAEAVSPALDLALARFRDSRWATDAQTVAGAPFWQGPEMAHAPGLIDASLEALTTRTETA